jgi:hypothetical protein
MSQWKIAVTEQGIRERIDARAPWLHPIDLGSGIQIQFPVGVRHSGH